MDVVAVIIIIVKGPEQPGAEPIVVIVARDRNARHRLAGRDLAGRGGGFTRCGLANRHIVVVVRVIESDRSGGCSPLGLFQ